MELSLLLLENLLSMLLMAMVGYVVARRGLINEKECAAFSRLVVYIFMPCMIFKAMQIELTEERIRGFLVLFVFSVLVHVIWIIFGTIFQKTMKISGVNWHNENQNVLMIRFGICKESLLCAGKCWSAL